VDSYLKNQQDIFGTVLQSLTGNSMTMSNRIASSLSQQVTTNFMNSLRTLVSSTQSIRIGASAANSIYVNGVRQQFRASSIGNLTATNTVMNQLKQSADFTVLQTLINENDTIGSLVNSYLRTIESLADFATSASAQILIIIGCILMCVMMIAGWIYLSNPVARAKLESFVSQQVTDFALTQASQLLTPAVPNAIPVATGVPPPQPAPFEMV
jgi:cobalamin biosynthesis Mg chelatase CobN